MPLLFICIAVQLGWDVAFTKQYLDVQRALPKAHKFRAALINFELGLPGNLLSGLLAISHTSLEKLTNKFSGILQGGLCHADRWKLAMVEMFTPWKLVNAAHQAFYPQRTGC